MRVIDQIYIHCSYHPYGDFDLIDKWHREREFPSYFDPYRKRTCWCGYHYLVCNPYLTYTQYKKGAHFTSISDGKLVPARPTSIKGAHVRGANYRSIGIMYHGITPTPLQLETMYDLCVDLIIEHNIDLATGVLGHHEYYTLHGQPMIKTCPNFDMPAFRAGLEWRLNVRLA